MVKVLSDREMSGGRSCNYKVVIKPSMARKLVKRRKMATTLNMKCQKNTEGCYNCEMVVRDNENKDDGDEI